MQIKIDYLKIKNFKGINEFELKLSGESATISGQNGTGKTTVADAFFWLVTNSNLDQRSNFNIIKLDEIGLPVDDLPAEVEAGVWFGSKRKILKKIYMQVWKQKKGKAKAEFAGHTTEYFIDGNLISQKEYLSDMDADIFRCLSDPLYFCSKMQHKARREILFKVGGVIKNEEIFKLHEKFKPIKHHLEKYTPDETRQQLRRKQKEAETIIDEIPGMIKGLKEVMPETPAEDENDLQSELNRINTEITKINNNVDNVKKLNRIALAEAEIETITAAMNSAIEKIKNRQNNGNGEILAHKKESLKNNIEIIESLEQQIKEKSLEQDDLRHQWKKISKREHKQSDTCYACGQTLPPGHLAKQKEKFKQERDAELNEINIKGLKYKDDIIALQSRKESIKERNKKIQDAINAMEDAAFQIDKINKDKINAIEEKAENDKLKVIEQIKKLRFETSEQDDTSQLEIEQGRINEKLMAITQIYKIEAKINAHEANLKKFATQHEALEKELFLLSEFQKIKAEFIEDTINSHFSITQWKLFEIHQNGNMRETCEPMSDGVPFSTDLNTGARINVGLDCIATLSNHMGIKCPIFVDNAESITSWGEIDGQVIKLKAVEDEKELTVVNGI